MFWALPSECHRRWKQRGLDRGSDFVAINTSGTPDQARWSVFFGAKQTAFNIQHSAPKETGGKGTSQLCY